MNIDNKRCVFLDTETTGKNDKGLSHLGHRVIEIGAIEVVNRKITEKSFHIYLNPDMKVDEDAIKVHGITDDFLKDKPHFNEIMEEFTNFINGSILIIHNAKFDVGFLNQEYEKNSSNIKIENLCTVVDSYNEAKKELVGQTSKFNLDSLCKLFGIDNSSRTVHGALLDAQLLAEMYLKMTGGQSNLELSINKKIFNNQSSENIDLNIVHNPLKIIFATKEEELEHEKKIKSMEKKGKVANWSKYENFWQK